MAVEEIKENDIWITNVWNHGNLWMIITLKFRNYLFVLNNIINKLLYITTSLISIRENIKNHMQSMRYNY
jgi:hypothetical protein